MNKVVSKKNYNINQKKYTDNLEDDWGFYIDIEAHDWNHVSAIAPIKIDIKDKDNNRKTKPPTVTVPPPLPVSKEEIQRHIALSSPKEEHPNSANCFNDIIKKTVSVVIIAAIVFC
jgi:hypothetical protein